MRRTNEGVQRSKLYGRMKKTRKKENLKSRCGAAYPEIGSPGSPIKSLKSDLTVMITASWMVMRSSRLDILLFSMFAKSKIRGLKHPFPLIF